MAQISPFRGLRYNQEKISSYAEVITPPYDVITPEDQKELYNRSDYNLIRMEYGLEQHGDDENSNRYTRAASTFRQWLDKNILIREDIPVLYWYEQQFTWQGNTCTRQGLISTLKVEPYENKTVLPHEETLSKPKADRLRLLDKCRANFSPIFGLYPDKENLVERECSVYKKNEPVVSFTDHDGQSHRLWLIEDPSLHKRLKELFSKWSILLADGHHRYETALHFSKMMASENKNGYDHVLSFLFNIYDPGLLILPTHRVINGLKDFDAESFLNKLNENFIIEDYGPADKAALSTYCTELKEKGSDDCVIGVCAAGRLYQLKYRYGREQLTLDVDILQKYIVEQALNLTAKDLRDGDLLTYTRSEEEALTTVCNHEAQISFFLNPSPMEDIIASAKNGTKLPQKSTYFYPKLISGLLINKLGE